MGVELLLHYLIVSIHRLLLRGDKAPAQWANRLCIWSHPSASRLRRWWWRIYGPLGSPQMTAFPTVLSQSQETCILHQLGMSLICACMVAWVPSICGWIPLVLSALFSTIGKICSSEGGHWHPSEGWSFLLIFSIPWFGWIGPCQITLLESSLGRAPVCSTSVADILFEVLWMLCGMFCKLLWFWSRGWGYSRMATNTNDLGLLNQPTASLRIGGIHSNTPCLYLPVDVLKRYHQILGRCVLLQIVSAFLPDKAMMLNLLIIWPWSCWNSAP